MLNKLLSVVKLFFLSAARCAEGGSSRRIGPLRDWRRIWIRFVCPSAADQSGRRGQGLLKIIFDAVFE